MRRSALRSRPARTMLSRSDDKRDWQNAAALSPPEKRNRFNAIILMEILEHAAKVGLYRLAADTLAEPGRDRFQLDIRSRRTFIDMAASVSHQLLPLATDIQHQEI